MRQSSQQFYDTWGNSSTQVICFMFLSFTNVETPSDSWTNTQNQNKKTEIILKKTMLKSMCMLKNNFEALHVIKINYSW